MMAGARAVLVWGLQGLKEVPNASKTPKNRTFRATTIIYHILLNLGRNLKLSNTHVT